MAFIKSGSGSFDTFIGGGLQPGYPWLFVTDLEAEGTAVTVACTMSWHFVARGYPTLIMTARHPWGISMERYKTSIPEIHQNLERAGRTGNLFVVNFVTKPKPKAPFNYELSLSPTFYPTQIYEEIAKMLEGLKASRKPLFWRLSSISNLVPYWTSSKIINTLESLLPYFHGRGAVGVTTLNRELVSEMMVKQAVSLFPNVAYVDTERKQKVRYNIQIVKAYNPNASSQKRELKITPQYDIVIG
ncbi:MAG: hypothetical protein ACE5OT_01345 [Candidatus Hadarchaeaceae archaeon]